MRKIGKLYDMIWVYGPPDFYDPLTGLDVPANVRAKMKFVGFLQRGLSQNEEPDHGPKATTYWSRPAAAATAPNSIHSVHPRLPAGPEPQPPRAGRARALHAGQEAAQADAQGREAFPFIEMIEFDNRMEELIAGAKAVVAMGGYNTYCEILSFDKPALIVPRVRPREEQLIRARRAAELGLIEMLLPDEAGRPAKFAAALRRCLTRPRRRRRPTRRSARRTAAHLRSVGRLARPAIRNPGSSLGRRRTESGAAHGAARSPSC